VNVDPAKKQVNVAHVFKSKKASKKNPGSVKGTPDLITLSSSTQENVTMVEAHHSLNAV